MAEPVPAAEEESKAVKKQSRGILRGFLTAFLSLFLIGFSVVFLLVIFLHGMAEDVSLPALGGMDSDLVFGALYPVILCGVLVLVFLGLIVFVNKPRVRRAFFAGGLSFLLLSALCFTAGLFSGGLAALLPELWQDALLAAVPVFRDLASITSVFVLLLGAVFLSVYFCIRAIRRERA